MQKKLLAQACLKWIVGLILVSLLLFLPAGTLHYPHAWLFIGLLFIPMFFAGLVMLVKSPELLEKRLHAKESESEQKQVIALSGLMFVAGFIVAALDFRFGWSRMPRELIFAASIVFLAAYVCYGEVIRENAYLSRTIEVQEGQKVIGTGLYSIVRHPMYFATGFLFLSIPLILGSVYAFVIFLIYPILLVKRIRNEETVLKQSLPGYLEYTQKVPYRLIPFIW